MFLTSLSQTHLRKKDTKYCQYVCARATKVSDGQLVPQTQWGWGWVQGVSCMVLSCIVSSLPEPVFEHSEVKSHSHLP